MTVKETETHTRKYVWGKLTLYADFGNAADPIRYSIDGDDPEFTPYQVANARHSVGEAFRIVNQWLKSQN